ncbi:MAG: CaiB/BaiF CoA-transferase family protein [Thermoplasmata archaeon]
MDGPMNGMRVLDLTRLLPGGLATQLLADLGAEVLKVEEPVTGDYMRYAPPIVNGASYSFLLVNQGKKSVALNLKESRGRELFYRLIPTADVLIEQFRPGVVERLGVGYEDVRALKADIVYCSLSGYGASGPYRKRPGHDLNFDALSGLLHMNSRAGRPLLPAVPVADMASGLMAAYAILAALLLRGKTGKGSFLDLSIFDTTVHMNLMNLAEALAGTEPQPEKTFLTGVFPCYNVYETADGRFIALAAIEEQFWDRFCHLVERHDLREKHLVVGDEAILVREALQGIFKQKTLKEWNQTFEGQDIPFAPVLTVHEAINDRHMKARRILKESRLPVETLPTLTHPVKWSPPGPERSGGPPSLGEHTLEILKEAGVSEADLKVLAERGIVRLQG